MYDAYTKLNLRYSQLAPLTTYDEKNTGTNLPAQIEIYSTPQTSGKPEYKFLFMAKGGGSANKSFLFQETKAVLNPTRMLEFLDEKIRSLGTAACPPYHLAVVIGGTSAEFALKTAKYASAHYLDNLPTEGSMSAHGFRDLELEEEVFELTQSFGIGAQFGGKYFCHDVRVVRLPRHGASCPVAIAVSCSADRQALGKITAEGVFLEQLETDPAHYMPDAGVTEDIAGGEVVAIDLNRPMAEILAELSRHPVKTRLSLTGPLVVARDIAHAKIKERLDAGEEMPRLPEGPRRLLRRPGEDPRGHRVGLLRPDHGRPDGLLRRAVPGRRRLDGDARQGQPLEGRHAGVRHARRLLPRLDRRPGRPARPGLHQVSRRCSSTPSSAWRRSGRSRSRTSRRSSSSTTRATTSSPTRPAPSPCPSPGSGCARPSDLLGVRRDRPRRVRARRAGAARAAPGERTELRSSCGSTASSSWTPWRSSSERALASAALDLVDAPRAVVVGGLGLGFTMHEVLADSRVEKVAVVEIEEALVGWMRDGTVPHGPALLADERVTSWWPTSRSRSPRRRPRRTTWCCSTSTTAPATWCTTTTRRSTSAPFLADRRAALRPGGALVVWSSAEAPALPRRCGGVFGEAEASPYDVQLQDRDEQYWLYVARVPSTA